VLYGEIAAHRYPGDVPRRDRPSRAKQAAWEEFLRTHLQLVTRLDHELVERHGIPLAWYDVLVQLHAAGGEATMGELAERLLIVPSTCTRLVARMSAAGLVERRVDDDDARVRHAELTRLGRSQLKSAAVTHLAGIQRYFGRHLTEAEATEWAAVLQRMRRSAGAT
jgi:DNA-binding MarR family transcriptional regulator